MAFKKIPKLFSNEQMAADLKAILLYSDHLPVTVVGEIAEIMGVARRTVYSILDGQIKISLDFLHAAVIATGGDPEVRKYLEPDGYELDRCKCDYTAKSLAEECLDDVPALAQYHKVLNDPKSRSADVKRAVVEVVSELNQNMMAWCRDRGESI